ncbi:GreA/GreB family elongation factor [Egicoccus sp. AB-alg6-2]|uniref:GreA/GreB family elongation factor n=1 Tax=Egicoccus sp. AB-alg6-2 TaxID=3242692 RepID=UPI00359EB3B8
MAADVPAKLPLVLTAEGRAWLQARMDRLAARLESLERELARGRTDDLIAEQRTLRDQADELSRTLRDAVAPGDVVDDPTIVELGDEVEVAFDDGSREAFLVVHPLEAALDDHRTSAEAPLAQAVLGRRPGDVVTVSAPAGAYRCTIVRRDRIG